MLDRNFFYPFHFLMLFGMVKNTLNQKQFYLLSIRGIFQKRGKCFSKNYKPNKLPQKIHLVITSFSSPGLSTYWLLIKYWPTIKFFPNDISCSYQSFPTYIFTWIPNLGYIFRFNSPERQNFFLIFFHLGHVFVNNFLYYYL